MSFSLESRGKRNFSRVASAWGAHTRTLETGVVNIRRGLVLVGAALLFCLVFITVASIYGVRLTAKTEQSVLASQANNLIDAERLALAFEQKAASSRAFLLSGDPLELGRIGDSRKEFYRIRQQLGRTVSTEEGKHVLESIASHEGEHHDAVERAIKLRQSGASSAEVAAFWSKAVQPAHESTATELTRFADYKRGLLEQSERDAERASTRVIGLLTAIAIIVILIGVVSYGVAAGALTRSMLRESDTRSELTESQRRLQALIESAMDAIISCDAHQNIIIFNRAAETMFRTSAGEVIGQSLNVLIPHRYRESHVQHVNRFRETGVSSRTMQSPGTLYGLRKDGEEFPIEATIAQASAGGEKIFTVILRDITARLHSEAALIKNEKLATAGLMAGTIAHEINNPLESLSGAIFLLKHEDVPESARALVDLVDKEMTRLIHITRQTLGFYRESSEPQVVDTRALLQEVVNFYRRKLDAKKIAVTVDGKDNSVVEGFPGELRQVFSNLVINAVDALGVGGDLFIDVTRTSSPGSGVVVTVRDNGSGIPPHARERVFQPFFSTKSDKGTGLGLWVSKALVEKHGGAIRFRSSSDAQDHGTTFEVFLPEVAPAHPAMTRRSA